MHFFLEKTLQKNKKKKQKKTPYIALYFTAF